MRWFLPGSGKDNADPRPVVTAARRDPLGATLGAADPLLTIAGALTALAGAVLPWIRLELFGVPVAVPGVAGLGLVGAAAAALALLRLRPFPVARLLLALIPLIVGVHGARSVGRDAARSLLSLQVRLAAVNARLEQVSLPPLEPFGAIGRRRELTGPGPLWMGWGGGLLVGGALAGIAAGRRRRTCLACGTLWRPERASWLAFCPACGARADGLRACGACRGPLEPGDQFCGSCGKSAE